MTNLVYWYGTYDNLESAYSFLPENKLIPFELGKKRVESKLVSLGRKSRLKYNDELLQKGVLEMEEDLKKDPSERSGNIGTDFLEVYEHIIEPGQEYVPDPNHVVLASTPSKPKKAKGVKRKLSNADEEAPFQESAGEAPIKKKKKKKKISLDETSAVEASLPLKKRKKKKKQLTDVMNDAGNDEVNKATHQGGEVQAAPLEEEQRMSAYDEYVMAMAEERSHGDTDDEDLDVAGLASDEDVADDTYPSDTKTEQKKIKAEKSNEPKTTRIKEPPKKKGTKAKAKIEKRPKGEKKAPTEEAKRRAEQRRFEMCEQKYAPLIRRWKKALMNKDADQISRIYGELLDVVEKFTAPFIQVYDLSARMKESKKIVNNEQRKKLLGKLKDQYTSKSKDVPAGFVPEKATREPGPAVAAAKPEQIVQQKVSTPEKVKSKKAMNEEKESKPHKKKGNDGDISKPDAGPSSPHIESLDRKPDSVPSHPLNAKQSAVSKLDKKKKFSLGNLMRPPSVPLPEDADTKQGSAIRPGESSATAPIAQTKARIWMSQVSDVALRVVDGNRLVALEFLRQAAPYVPLTKGINHDAIARNLEVAIYEWASCKDHINGVSLSSNGHGNVVHGLGDENTDKYWNKLHSVVAGISGKRRPGTIAKMIGDGKFEAANDLVELSDDSLYQSFQGKPMAGF
jgi:hypothetical protein